MVKGRFCSYVIPSFSECQGLVIAFTDRRTDGRADRHRLVILIILIYTYIISIYPLSISVIFKCYKKTLGEKIYYTLSTMLRKPNNYTVGRRDVLGEMF